jgi:hypothetical protein
MLLPSKQTDGVMQMETCSWLIYGQPGIGKSTFASNFPDVLFLCTETSQRHLKIYRCDIPNWETYLKVVTELVAMKPLKYKTIVIDTIDLLYKMCLEYVSKKKGVDHVSDESHGKGWDALNQEFHSGLLKLLHLPAGKVLICHYKQREVKARGITYEKTIPSMSASCWRVVCAEVDVIGFCDFDPESPQRRILRYRPELELEAKDRGGVFPIEPGYLPLNYSKVKEAFGKGDGPLQGDKGRLEGFTSRKVHKVHKVHKLSK